MSSNTAAYELVAGMSVLPIGNPIRPAEVGSPWSEIDPLAGFFHDEDQLRFLSSRMGGSEGRACCSDRASCPARRRCASDLS